MKGWHPIIGEGRFKRKVGERTCQENEDDGTVIIPVLSSPLKMQHIYYSLVYLIIAVSIQDETPSCISWQIKDTCRDFTDLVGGIFFFIIR